MYTRYIQKILSIHQMPITCHSWPACLKNAFSDFSSSGAALPKAQCLRGHKDTFNRVVPKSQKKFSSTDAIDGSLVDPPQPASQINECGSVKVVN